MDRNGLSRRRFHVQPLVPVRRTRAPRGRTGCGAGGRDAGGRDARASGVRAGCDAGERGGVRAGGRRGRAGCGRLGQARCGRGAPRANGAGGGRRGRTGRAGGAAGERGGRGAPRASAGAGADAPAIGCGPWTRPGLLDRSRIACRGAGERDAAPAGGMRAGSEVRARCDAGERGRAGRDATRVRARCWRGCPGHRLRIVDSTGSAQPQPDCLPQSGRAGCRGRYGGVRRGRAGRGRGAPRASAVCRRGFPRPQAADSTGSTQPRPDCLPRRGRAGRGRVRVRRGCTWRAGADAPATGCGPGTRPGLLNRGRIACRGAGERDAAPAPAARRTRRTGVPRSGMPPHRVLERAPRLGRVCAWRMRSFGLWSSSGATSTG